MKLFILEIIDWEYDCAASCVVLAENEDHARELAFKDYEQKRLSFVEMKMIHTHTVEYNQKWLDSDQSKCNEIDMNSCGVIHDYIANG